jgi:hypothetical protein
VTFDVGSWCSWCHFALFFHGHDLMVETNVIPTARHRECAYNSRHYTPETLTISVETKDDNACLFRRSTTTGVRRSINHHLSLNQLSNQIFTILINGSILLFYPLSAFDCIPLIKHGDSFMLTVSYSAPHSITSSPHHVLENHIPPPRP